MARHARTARRSLRFFRAAHALSFVLTALLLLVWDPAGRAAEEPPPAPGEAGEAAGARAERAPPAPPGPDDALEAAGDAVREATGTIRGFGSEVLAFLPKLALALLLLAVAAVLARLVRALLRRTASHWSRAVAFSALVRVALYLVAAGAALSVLAGDVRALLGSVGLVGLALSWALQTPIESFTGWLLNSLRGYYRVGDRIEVGAVFGDVFRIDVLTTTVWEAGGPGKAVAGAQPTGALVTFPNSEILRASVINYTREFPYVWDEVSVGVANESDLAYTMEVLERVARDTVGAAVEEPAQLHGETLRSAGQAFDVAREPQVFLALAETWTTCVVRYLVPVRERRRWASRLVLAWSLEAARPEHAGRIVPAWPRSEVRLRERFDVRGEPE